MKLWKATALANLMYACSNYSEITINEASLISDWATEHLDKCESIKEFRDSTGCCFKLIIVPNGITKSSIFIECQCDKKIWIEDLKEDKNND